jgi:hypothetical protein
MFRRFKPAGSATPSRSPIHTTWSGTDPAALVLLLMVVATLFAGRSALQSPPASLQGQFTIAGSTALEPLATQAVSDQTGELARLSAAFARDVVQTARQVGTLNHELRTGVMPFRVDTTDGESSLYAPGTGYGEVSQQSAPLYRPDPPSGSATATGPWHATAAPGTAARW